MKRRPGRLRTKWLDRRFEEQKGKCFYCTRVMTRQRSNSHQASCDHVDPLSLQGPDVFENIVAACLFCNSMKANIPRHLFIRWAKRYQSMFSDHKLIRRHLLIRANRYKSSSDKIADAESDLVYYPQEKEISC